MVDLGGGGVRTSSCAQNTFHYLCVTNPALCNDKLVSQCAVPSGSPCDDKIITLVYFKVGQWQINLS